MRPKNINIHIEELVLHGFSPGDRYRIKEAVENELERLLAEREIPASLASGRGLEKIDGGSFEVQKNSRPEKVGAQIAQSVYRGLQR